MKTSQGTIGRPLTSPYLDHKYEHKFFSIYEIDPHWESNKKHNKCVIVSFAKKKVFALPKENFMLQTLQTPIRHSCWINPQTKWNSKIPSYNTYID